jgi:hypothetical protein
LSNLAGHSAACGLRGLKLRPLVLLKCAVEINPAMLRDALTELEAKLAATNSTTSATVSTPAAAAAAAASGEELTTSPADVPATAPATDASAAAGVTTTNSNAAESAVATAAAAVRDSWRLELTRAILKRRKEGSKAWSPAVDARAVALLRSM